VVNRAGNDGVPVCRIGTTGGNALTLPAQRTILVTTLSERFENWLPGYMSGANS
jgi:phosphoribosylformylglycinamidine synthase subunit PurL